MSLLSDGLTHEHHAGKHHRHIPYCPVCQPPDTIDLTTIEETIQDMIDNGFEDRDRQMIFRTIPDLIARIRELETDNERLKIKMEHLRPHVCRCGLRFATEIELERHTETHMRMSEEERKYGYW